MENQWMVQQQPVNSQPQVVYQADHQAVSALKKQRDQICAICQQHPNRYVQVTTIDGEVYEGHISHTDQHHLYLMTNTANPYNSRYAPVLPLVLYNLLVISLLY